MSNTRKESRDERANRIANEMIREERAKREQKTARLRELRLAREHATA
jgi:hypothetical protein